jgi:hypothetical protein
LRVALVVAVACLVAVGVAAERRPDPALRQHRVDAELRGLQASLDQLEDRLVVDQARVHFWQEMRARHESVTAIACTSQDHHAQEMAERMEAEAARPGRRVAKVDPAAIDEPVSRARSARGGAGGPR